MNLENIRNQKSSRFGEIELYTDLLELLWIEDYKQNDFIDEDSVVLI